ncbi:class I SAM-dependent methyltransferase [bacterium]|nr:class I SAM-dependent methyltransferase [bacterium]
MFEELNQINSCPKLFEFYTASELWTDEHISKQMLSFHLNEHIDVASRKVSFIDRSVDWMIRHFNIGVGTRIIDFGCGPGLYTIRLARHEAAVTGIDFSRRSIRYAQEAARKENLSVSYIWQNYLEFKTNERYNLVLMVMCDFCVLSPSQRKIMLRKFHNNLHPGGAVLLDVYSLAAFEKREKTALCEANLNNGFWSLNDYYGFQNTFKFEMEKVVLDKYTIIEADRTRTFYNWLQYFNPETIEREFTDCGFVIKDIYADVAGSQYYPESLEFAVVARKK